MTHDEASRRSFLKQFGVLSAIGAASVPLRSAEISNSIRPALDQPRDLPATAADLGTLYSELQKLVANREYSDSFLGNRYRTWEECQRAGRARVLDALLYRPEKVEPRAEVVERIDCGDFLREKVLFSTSPHFRVPAYVLVPKKLNGRGPAIVDLHSHGGMFLFGKEKVMDLGENHVAMVDYHERNYDGRPTATALVRRGYVVITIDALFFGERRVLLDADLKAGWERSKYSLEQVRQLNQQCRSKESTLVKSMAFAGLTWPGIVFWDDIRTVDYLVSRPEVDPERLGCLGISMGGYRSLFLSGLDSRIRAGCVVGFMSTVDPMLRAHVDTHSNVHFLPAIHQYLDWPDIVALHAPKPLLVQQCEQDRLFPLAGMHESVDKIAAIYDKVGAKNQFTGSYYDVPHRFTRTMQDDAFAWFDEKLK